MALLPAVMVVGLVETVVREANGIMVGVSLPEGRMYTVDGAALTVLPAVKGVAFP